MIGIGTKVRTAVRPGSRVLKILVVGKDARTVAMALRCSMSRDSVEIFAVSESRIPALHDLCRELFVVDSLIDTAGIVRIATSVGADLVLIGPEEPLGAGLVDGLEAAGIRACFGPTAALARIETSKSWARQLVDEYAIPGNPRYRIFESADGIEEVLRALGEFVVKPDGLTGGKGVKVSGEHLHSVAEGRDYAISILESGAKVLIEEKLDGEEFSLQTITDGETVVHCPLVQDHKRSDDGDQGPNTGGMGSYSIPNFSLPFLEDADVLAAQSINEKVIRALRSKTGRPYKGVLYGGFIATSDGIRLIEYNARFGDPEAMNVLSILETDFVDLCLAVVDGTLSGLTVSFSPKASVCKYVVPIKYPAANGVTDEITVPRRLPDDTYAFWAATNLGDDGKTYMTGSRAIAFVGVGDTVADAERRAERAARSVTGPVRHRGDVGTAELVGKRVEHMRRLRSSVTECDE